MNPDPAVPTFCIPSMNTLSPVLSGSVEKFNGGVVKVQVNVVPIPVETESTSTMLIPFELFLVYNLVVFSESPFGCCSTLTLLIELPTISASKIPLSIIFPLSVFTITISGGLV